MFFFSILQTTKKLEEPDIQEAAKSVLCKPLLICSGMMFFYQFAGYNVVTNFAGTILQKDEEILLNKTKKLEPSYVHINHSTLLKCRSSDP